MSDNPPIYLTDVVRPGENLRLFAERHGVDHQRILSLNGDELRNEAQARGFDSHTFMRPVPDPDGGAVHNGIQVRQEVDAHVFTGQVLKVRPAEEAPTPEPKTPSKVTQSAGGKAN